MRFRQWKLPIISIVLVLAAALLAGCTVGAQPVTTNSHAPTAAASALGDRVGINVGSATTWADAATRKRSIKAIADTGAHILSMDLDWNSVNGAGPSTFRWGPIDQFVREVRANGLKIVAGIAYSPSWAVPASCPAGTTHCLPASPEPYATFAAAAAARYGSRSTIPDLRNAIMTWQIWNEPNNSEFAKPAVNVGAYTTLLKRAYVEIKKADPASTVLAAGTSPAPDDPSGKLMSPVTFMKNVYANGGKGYFDAWAHHPYSFPCSPLVNASWNAFTQTSYLHDVMVQNGDGNKKIWATEAGAPTGKNVGPCAAGPNVSVTEATQAQFVADYFKGWNENFASFTGPFLYFQIRDNGTDPNNYDDHFGLLRRDFSPKPAYNTFKSLIAGAKGTKPAPPATPAPPASPPATPAPPATPTPPVVTPTPPPSTGAWVPKVGESWQYQLSGSIDTSVNASVFDIDGSDTSAATVATLHAQGKHAICYVDVGSWEDWRPDAGQFPASIQGKSNGWPGEKWLDIRQTSILAPIIGARFDTCKAKGFDAVEPDNVDGYTNSTGFPLTAANQLTYNKLLASLAHERGLAVGLKNDVDQAQALVSSFDFAVNEECFAYSECDALKAFISAGKPVFHVEYDVATSKFCPTTKALGFSSILKDLDLDAARQACS